MGNLDRLVVTQWDPKPYQKLERVAASHGGVNAYAKKVLQAVLDGDMPVTTGAENRHSVEADLVVQVGSLHREIMDLRELVESQLTQLNTVVVDQVNAVVHMRKSQLETDKLLHFLLTRGAS
jgi:hypothetical protein